MPQATLSAALPQVIVNKPQNGITFTIAAGVQGTTISLFQQPGHVPVPHILAGGVPTHVPANANSNYRVDYMPNRPQSPVTISW